MKGDSGKEGVEPLAVKQTNASYAVFMFSLFVSFLIFFVILDDSGRLFYSVAGALVIGFGLVYPLTWFFGLNAISDLRKESDEQILICPRCGSTDMSAFKHAKHWLKNYGPVMGIYTCQDCGYDGLPIAFDSREEYGDFLRQRGEKEE